MDPRLGRRTLIRRAAGLMAATGGGLPWLALSRTALASPGVGDPVTKLVFMPEWIAYNPVGTDLMNEATAQFDATHPGLRLRATPGPQANNSPVGTVGAILSMVSGDGPDVVGDCCNAWTQYLAAGVAAPLDAYLRRDNVSRDLWAAGHLDALTTRGALYGLPAYDGPEVFVYRQDLLDELGLQYPAPDWTYADAARLWRQSAATVHGKPRYGAVVEWYTAMFQGPVYLLKGFGGAEMDASGTRCLFDSAGSVAAGQWLYPMLWEKVVAPRDLGTDWGGSIGLVNGSAVFQIAGGWDILPFTQAFGDSFKWDFIPVPRWPKGRATFTNNDFWIMNANSRHPDASWEVMKWVAAEPTYQRFLMKTILLPPSLLSLWDEFVSLMEATAPVLRGKALHYYRDVALAGYGYPEQFFKYQPAQADTLINQQIARLWQRQVDVVEAFTTASEQVDALEKAGEAEAGETALHLATYREYLPRALAARGTIEYPPPPRQGAGVPATEARPSVVVGRGGTAYTVTGAGAGGVGGTSDNGTFACQPYRYSRGTFICRLSALSAPDGRPFPGGAIAGLMARGDLADGAACALVAAVSTSGTNFDLRPVESQDMEQNGPWLNGAGAIYVPGAHTAPTSPGLIAANAVFAARPGPKANVLGRPIWFRLAYDVNRWQPYVSWDGVHWLAANPPANPVPIVECSGAWVGLFISSAAAGRRVEGIFDHVGGFVPNTFVQVGSP